MPVVKNRQERFKILNECLRDSHRHYTYDSLLEELNRQLLLRDAQPIQLRMLKEDIKYIREEFDIEFDSELDKLRPKVLRYADLSASIYQLTDEETDALQTTIDMLLQYPEPRPIQYDYIRVCLQQMQRNQHLNVDSPVASFSDNLDHKGREFFVELCGYIMEQQTIKLHYKPYRGDEFQVVIYPYLLKQFNERWFLIAGEEGIPRPRVYALDRIEALDNSYLPYKPSDIDFDSYFDDIIGVTMLAEQKMEEVLLKVSATRYPYIVTKPIHSSQKLISSQSNEEYKTISLSLKPNLELESLILSFGEDVEVLEPQWLREKIAQQITHMLDKYNIDKQTVNENGI